MGCPFFGFLGGVQNRKLRREKRRTTATVSLVGSDIKCHLVGRHKSTLKVPKMRLLIKYSRILIAVGSKC